MKEKLAQQIIDGRNKIMGNKYFKNIDKMNTIKDFEPMCVDLHYLAAEFLRVITIRYERFRDEPEDIFLTHMNEEKGHAEMLRKWMMRVGMVDPLTAEPSKAVKDYVRALETAATHMSKELSLLLINGCGEGTAQDFYHVTLKRLRELGFDKLAYWELHAEVDQEHGEVMHLLPEMNENESYEASEQVDVMLDIINNLKENWAVVA